MKRALILTLCLFLVSGAWLFAGGKQEAVTGEEAAAVETDTDEWSQTVGTGNLAQYDTMDEFQKETGKSITQFNEAPILAERVSAGELPPVAERIPANPQIIEPVEQIGEYGGTVNVFTARTMRTGEGAYLAGVDGIFRIGPDMASIVPNVAVDWEFADEGRRLTVFIREGMRWSDGTPFTADDIMFWYEDVLLNDELTPVKSADFRPGGELMELFKVDDYTVRFEFAEPYPAMELLLGHYVGAGMFLPKHYLKQFHINYNDNANELAKENEFESWIQLFEDMNRMGFNQTPLNPDLPTIKAFKCLEWTSTHSLLERNPYYWKIDTAGNQLPYFDRVFSQKVEEKEILDAKVMSGEFDFAAKNTNLMSYPLYKENEETNNYRVLLWPGIYGGNIVYQPNQTSTDPVLREIFQDVRFRRALSLAINRDEINETMYFGLGTPRQMTVIPESKYFEPEFADSYVEYDVDRANELLDEMGLEWNANREFRLRPDGKRLAWTLEFYPVTSATAAPQVNQLIKEYWAELGIDLSLKQENAEFYTARVTANEIDMNLWTGDKVGDILFLITPTFFVPYSTAWGVNWGRQWAQWYQTQGKGGEEPPAEPKQLLEWWEGMKTTLDEEERIRLGKNILRSQAENLWVIGTVGMLPTPFCVRNTIRNVPDGVPFGWDLLYTTPYHPEQFYMVQ